MFSKVKGKIIFLNIATELRVTLYQQKTRLMTNKRIWTGLRYQSNTSIYTYGQDTDNIIEVYNQSC